MGKLSDKAHWKRCLTWTKRRKEITCTSCGSIFIPIAGFDKRDIAAIKTCTTECAASSRSATMKERHKDKKWSSMIGRRGGKASALVQVRRSKDEIALYKLCEQQYNVIHNKIIADGWDADIVFPDQKVAVLWNGPWHYKEMPVSNHSLRQVQNRDRIKTKLFENLGWLVLMYEDRTYTPTTAFIDIQSKLCGVV